MSLIRNVIRLAHRVSEDLVQAPGDLIDPPRCRDCNAILVRDQGREWCPACRRYQ